MATPANLAIKEAAPQTQAPASKVSPPLSPAAASTCTMDGRPESYDVNEFVDGNAPADLQCTGCQRIPREPQVTQCCARVYCLSCLRAQDACEGVGKGGRGREGKGSAHHITVVRERARTLCCNSEKQLSYELDRARQQQLHSLQVKCLNEGCTWSGSVNSHLEEHSTTCVHAEIHCHKCGREVIRGNLDTHCRNVCRFRETQCRHCSTVGPYAEIVGLDSAVTKHKCPMIPVTCPNKCKGSKKMLRQALPEHLTVCPLQSVDCDYKTVGCDEKLARRSYAAHMKNAQQQHLLLLLNAMQTKISAVGSEIELLLKSVHDLTTLTSLACVQSHMKMGKLSLNGVGDQVTFRVRNYSHLKQNSGDDGKWESPPFYFLSSYPMELVVYPGGHGLFMGRSLSINLRVSKPENTGNSRDDQNVGWPIECAYLAVQISILPQLENKHTHSREAQLYKTTTAHICHFCRQRQDNHHATPEEPQDTMELKSEDNFVSSEAVVDAGLLHQDSVVLRVELTSCECVHE